MIAELEEARALGELREAGLAAAAHDRLRGLGRRGAGLLGSTGWVEHHAAELREKAVVYINTDSNGRGFLDAGGSHSLERLVNEVARDVEDPETRQRVAARRRAPS